MLICTEIQQKIKYLILLTVIWVFFSLFLHIFIKYIMNSIFQYMSINYCLSLYLFEFIFMLTIPGKGISYFVNKLGKCELTTMVDVHSHRPCRS